MCGERTTRWKFRECVKLDVLLFWNFPTISCLTAKTNAASELIPFVTNSNINFHHKCTTQSAGDRWATLERQTLTTIIAWRVVTARDNKWETIISEARWPTTSPHTIVIENIQKIIRLPWHDRHSINQGHAISSNNCNSNNRDVICGARLTICSRSRETVINMLIRLAANYNVQCAASKDPWARLEKWVESNETAIKFDRSFLLPFCIRFFFIIVIVKKRRVKQ